MSQCISQCLRRGLSQLGCALLIILCGCGADDRDKWVESQVLQQELLQLHVDSLPADRPPSPTALSDAQRRVEQEIQQLREKSPEFLCLPSSTEQTLQLGQSVPGAEQRISIARGFLAEYQVASPGIVQQLLVDHDTGKNGPVRTELLAQLLEVLQQQATEALSPGQ